MTSAANQVVERAGGCRRFAIALGLVLASAFLTIPIATAPAQTVAPTAPANLGLPSFAPLAKALLPAVVNVSATLKPGAGDDDSDDDQSLSPFDELLRRFFEQQGIPPQRPLQNERDIALGSGFIIDATGYIVTNGHVVENADKVTVIFNDNSRHPATIVGQDSLTDLALLKIDAPQPLPFVS